MSSKIVQMDMFGNEQKEKDSVERRLRHLFGRMSEADSEIEEHRQQLEQLWQIVGKLYQEKTP